MRNSHVKDDPERERRQGGGQGDSRGRDRGKDHGEELLQRLAADPNRGVHLDISF